jgi:hypothetical protein
MAVMTHKTLVQRGTCVVRDVVAGATGRGCQVVRQTSALAFPTRHPSACYRSFLHDRGLNPHDADNRAAAAAAERAGRPGSRTGVPSRRSPASLAGRAVRYQTALSANGEPRSMAVWRLGRVMPGRRPSLAKGLRRRLIRRAFAASTRG